MQSKTQTQGIQGIATCEATRLVGPYELDIAEMHTNPDVIGTVKAYQ